MNMRRKYMPYLFSSGLDWLREALALSTARHPRLKPIQSEPERGFEITHLPYKIYPRQLDFQMPVPKEENKGIRKPLTPKQRKRKRAKCKAARKARKRNFN